MKALGDIFVYIFAGGLILWMVRWILPLLVTGTSGTDNIMTYFYPLIILFAIIILCMLAFKKRRQQGSGQ
ncbi:hypothetical protein M0R04_08170 [Candidatus Dojkabacteria bacterium]|jgi:hypothetical protein|nr:hypothetical protein [Candidatus Dojkabacteria bacterium]